MRYTDRIILLVICMAFLLLTGYSVDAEEPETENPRKWSGLTGFTTSYIHVEDFADTWLDHGFTEIRDLRHYLDTDSVNDSKAAIIATKAKGLKFIWGVSAQSITAKNWPNFRQAILDSAQWAQDNGVFEFQIGNEEEYHVDEKTMTIAQIIINLKGVATEVQAIFTNGNVSYTCWQGSIGDWITAGKGDIDILASNIYMGGTTFNDSWKADITNLVNTFGIYGTYITEFAPSYISLDDYSTDEVVQAAGVTEMINHFKASGITRALYYEWIGDDFGVLKDDGTCRLLWNHALLNTWPEESTAVPTKTTTASLPGKITLLISKIIRKHQIQH